MTPIQRALLVLLIGCASLGAAEQPGRPQGWYAVVEAPGERTDEAWAIELLRDAVDDAV